MRDHHQPDQSDDLQDRSPASPIGDTEELDALVLLGEPRGVHPVRSGQATVPAAQAAAMAATSFLAGAAVVGIMHRRRRRSASPRQRRTIRGAGRMGEVVEIIGSRSLLVDIHLLDGSGRKH